MGAGIIRVEKVKATQLGGLQHHIDREGANHSNPDIDIARSGLNEAWDDRGDYEVFVRRRIEEGRTSDRKVRKDAVVLVDGIVTLPATDYAELGDEMTERYLQDAREFVVREFGEENLAYFTIHRDETVPHAHWGAVPLKDGSLSWKNYFGGREALSAFQDRFFEQVSSRYGLERGHKRGDGEKQRRHKETAELKAETEKELARAEQELAGKLAEIEQANVRLEWVRRNEDEAWDEVEQLAGRAEQLGVRRDSVAERVGGLERDVGIARDQVESLVVQGDEAAGRVERLGVRRDSAGERVERLVGERDEAEKRVERLEERRDEAEKRVEGLGVRRDSAGERVGGLERAIAEVRERIERFKEEIARAAERIAELMERKPVLPPLAEWSVCRNDYNQAEYAAVAGDWSITATHYEDIGLYDVKILNEKDGVMYTQKTDDMAYTWEVIRDVTGSRGTPGEGRLPEPPPRRNPYVQEQAQEQRRAPKLGADIRMATRSAQSYGGGTPPVQGRFR